MPEGPGERAGGAKHEGRSVVVLFLIAFRMSETVVRIALLPQEEDGFRSWLCPRNSSTASGVDAVRREIHRARHRRMFCFNHS